MPIRVECARCGAKFQVPEVHAGKRGRCKRCGNVVEIPKPASPDPAAPGTAARAVPSPTPAPAVNRILDEEEEYALATVPASPPASPAAARLGASGPHVPPPGAPQRDDMAVRRPLAVLLAGLLYFLVVIPIGMLGAALESAGSSAEPLAGVLAVLWLVGFPVVIVLGVLKCRVRYEASVSPTGKPILAIEKYFFGWRHACEILDLNDYRSMRRIDYEAENPESDQATGCLVLFLFGLPGLLIYSLAKGAGRQRARHEVQFISRSAAARDFTATFPKPRQAAELTKVVGRVTGLPLDRMTQFDGL